MRFEPPCLEYSYSDLDSELDNDSLNDFYDIDEQKYFNINNNNNNNIHIISTSSSDSDDDPSIKEDDIDSSTINLTQLLHSTGLYDRFKMVSEIDRVTPTYENTANHNINSPSLQTINDGSERRKKDASKPVVDHEVDFITQKLKGKLLETRSIVQKLIREEEERKRLEEEERKRKAEEERLRLEELKRQEEERRRKEAEAHAKALEEARLKAEAAAKKIEEERLAKEKKIKEEQEAKEKELEELTKKQVAETESRKLEETKRSQNIVNFATIESEFLEYKKHISDIKTTIIEPLNGNKDLKKIVSVHKRKINPKFGQLTNGIQRLNRITSELYELILQAKGQELAYKWILNFIAKAIVSQSETEVIVNANSSIPLATLTLNLLLLFPDLQYYLMARFVKKCPLVIGYTCSVETEEGRLRMGWKRKGDGKWEAEDMYNERLSGICTVFAVVCRLKIDKQTFSILNNAPSLKHPLAISNNWRLISRILNTPMDRITHVHYIAMGSWWDSTAFEFLEAYGKQGTKILQLTCGEWTSAVGDRRYAGAARLRLLGEEWTKNGVLKRFKAMEYTPSNEDE